MKKVFVLAICFIAIARSFATDYKLYLWVKFPKHHNYAYGLEVQVNNRRMGAIKVSEMAVLHLSGDKKYFLEVFDQGNSIGSVQINSLTDTSIYYQLEINSSAFNASININRQDPVKAAIFVAQPANYTSKLDFYEEGLEESADGPAYGTGFLISADGYIVTNNHVVDGFKKIKVKGIEGDYTTEYEAEVVARDINNDLVLLMLKNHSVKFTQPPYTIKTQGTSTGDDIFILGYPLGPALGEEIKLTTGVISAKSGLGGNVAHYQVSAAAQPGNSGGPLFDGQGNLLGIVNAKIMKAENITYALKSVYLQAMLGMLNTEPHVLQTGLLKDKTLAEKVAAVSKYVYIIKSE